MYNKQILLNEINRVYHDNKQMLLTLETKQQMLVRGMICLRRTI